MKRVGALTSLDIGQPSLIFSFSKLNSGRMMVGNRLIHTSPVVVKETGNHRVIVSGNITYPDGSVELTLNAVRNGMVREIGHSIATGYFLIDVTEYLLAGTSFALFARSDDIIIADTSIQLM